MDKKRKKPGEGKDFRKPVEIPDKPFVSVSQKRLRTKTLEDSRQQIPVEKHSNGSLTPRQIYEGWNQRIWKDMSDENKLMSFVPLMMIFCSRYITSDKMFQLIQWEGKLSEFFVCLSITYDPNVQVTTKFTVMQSPVRDTIMGNFIRSSESKNLWIPCVFVGPFSEEKASKVMSQWKSKRNEVCRFQGVSDICRMFSVKECVYLHKPVMSITKKNPSWG
jgi:hypothetical protein